MAGNEYTIKENRWVIALILSLCLHLLLILSYPLWDRLFIQPVNITAEREPLRFEFVENRAGPKQLIETGEASDRPPEQPDFLSDKQSIARNPERIDAAGQDMPYAQGDIRLGAISAPPMHSERTAEPRADETEEEMQPDGIHVRESAVPKTPRFNRDRLLGIQTPSESRFQEPTYKELESSVEEAGGVSFNTYAWEWAPYMFKLKEILRKNIYPPASFTRLGFGGAHLIRFRISRDGSLTGPDLLGYEGDKVLTGTSIAAVKMSSPFPELPKDFPDKTLEVTIQFHYLGKESVR